MKQLSIYVANVRSGRPGSSAAAPVAEVNQAAKDIAEACTVRLFPKCRQLADGRKTTMFVANPAYKHHGARTYERFDFVEEWAELWSGWDRDRAACRPVIQLRGFIELDFEGDETYHVALGQCLHYLYSCVRVRMFVFAYL